MSIRRTIGGVGAVLTCPCHALPLVMLLGGAAGTAWLFEHLGAVLASVGALFLGSLALLLTPNGAPRVSDAPSNASVAVTRSAR